MLCSWDFQNLTTCIIYHISLSLSLSEYLCSVLSFFFPWFVRLLSFSPHLQFLLSTLNRSLCCFLSSPSPKPNSKSGTFNMFPFLIALPSLIWSIHVLYLFVFQVNYFALCCLFFFFCWHLLFFGFETLALLGSIFMSLYYSFLECMFRAVSEFCYIILHACIWTWFHVFFSLFFLAFSIFFQKFKLLHSKLVMGFLLGLSMVVFIFRISRPQIEHIWAHYSVTPAQLLLLLLNSLWPLPTAFADIFVFREPSS